MEEPLLLVATALLALAAAGVVATWTIRVIWHRLRGRGSAELTARRGTAVRRRLRAMRADRASVDLAGLRLRARACRPRASAAWWSVRVTRRRLRLAVGAAEGTVAAAERVHAPLGELPVLCRDLRRLQRDLDRRLLLAAAHGGRPDRPTALQVATVRAHAEKIRLLAARSLEEAAEPALHRLAERVDAEGAALDAGLANWRRQTDPALPS
jgi:hypothetical protein